MKKQTTPKDTPKLPTPWRVMKNPIQKPGERPQKYSVVRAGLTGNLEFQVMEPLPLKAARVAADAFNAAPPVSLEQIAVDAAKDGAKEAGASSVIALVAMPDGKVRWVWWGDQKQCREMLTLNLTQLLGSLAAT